MHKIKCLSIVWLCAAALPAQAQKDTTDLVIKGGCTVQVKAYIDKKYVSPRESSRFDIQVFDTQKNTYSWDVTTGDEPNMHFDGMYGCLSPVPYGTKKQVTIRAVVHQYDTYEERVTFKNLDLGPLTFVLSPAPPDTKNSTTKTPAPQPAASATPRYLLLKKPITLTTPSGISITLPAQGPETIEKVFRSFNGNINSLFIQLKVNPNRRQVLLPESPLYIAHRKPVSITLEAGPQVPKLWFNGTNTSSILAVSMPDLSTARHLDSLTLIVRQRVDIQAIPVAIKVPVSPSPR